MKTKTPFAVLALLVGVMSMGLGCLGSTEPSIFNIINQNNNTNTNNNGQTGQGDPAAVPGSVKGKTKTVTVNAFVNGEKCPVGVTPANENKKVGLGCDLAVTCNPRDENGAVIQDDKAPPVDYFILLSGNSNVTFSQWASNSYNADVKTKAVGTFTMACSVVGITSGPQDFEVVKP